MTAPTNAQLKQMVEDDDRARRAELHQRYVSQAHAAGRIPRKRASELKGNRGNHKAHYAKEY